MQIDDELPGDLLIRHSLDDQPQHFKFPFSETDRIRENGLPVSRWLYL